MTPRSPEELHADPLHWKLAIFYFCREDHRILVPKRVRGLGWTINFARPSAYVWIVAVSCLAWGTVAMARSAGVGHDGLLVIKLLLAFGIVIFCHRAAHASVSNK